MAPAALSRPRFPYATTASHNLIAVLGLDSQRWHSDPLEQFSISRQLLPAGGGPEHFTDIRRICI